MGNNDAYAQNKTHLKVSTLSEGAWFVITYLFSSFSAQRYAAPALPTWM